MVVTILAGGTDVWRHDIEIPKKYGVDINVGDTRGPSGIFRALRTIPVMLEHRPRHGALCPDAIMLNYTNPMAMLCRAMSARDQHPADRPLSQRAGHRRHAGGLDRRTDGGDHLYLRRHQPHGLVSELRVERQGRLPADPQGDHRKRRESTTRSRCATRCSWRLDHYVTESSGHNSEYNWWFRKRPDLIEKYCTHGTGWNPGEYAYILKTYPNASSPGAMTIQKWFAEDDVLTWPAGTNTPPTSSTPSRVANRLSSTATSPTQG